MREAHSEDGVTRLKHREVDRHVRLSTRVRLNVGILRTEELLGAVTGDVLDDIDLLAPPVVTLAGIALGILVGEHGTGGLKDAQ